MSKLWIIVSALACAAAQTPERTPPEQPLPFSHKQHAGNLKLACKMCHPNPPPGEMMLIAAASVCMQCHSAIKADSPAIQKLAAFAGSGKPIPWVRVYQLPDYVFWKHTTHLKAKVTCVDCHGPVAERDVVAQETNIVTMAGCLACHNKRQVFIDCADCHAPRQ